MQRLKVHIRYLIIIVLIFTLISLVNYMIDKNELPSLGLILNYLGWSSFYTIPLYAANGFIYHLLDERIPESDWRSYVKKFLLGGIFSCVISVLVGTLLIFLNLIIEGNSTQEALNRIFSPKSWEQMKTLIWISISIAFTIYLIRFIIGYQAGKLQEQKERIVKITTEHESLKSQIGPHFLFNSLNVLNGLIEENPKKAQEFVSELSSIYRYVLEQKDKSLVSLEEELNFSQNYMNLVQKRFEDGLEFEIQGNANPDLKIVPLSLQILLENSIKHNRISSDEPLKIIVKLRENSLEITNNLLPKNKKTESTGKGLNNIISRYAAYTNRKVEISKTETDFSVIIPLLSEKLIAIEMEKNYTEEEILIAKKRVEEIKSFYWNLISYGVVNAFLLFIDLSDNGSWDWSFWPMLGWGIGIIFHGIEVFGFFNSHNWKERMIQKELERRKREREVFTENNKYGPR